MIRVVWFAGRGKMQRVPIHRDLAAADAEETAEIDDRGTHLAVAVDQHIDDPAHVLVGGAEHFAAKNALDLVLVENGLPRPETLRCAEPEALREWLLGGARLPSSPGASCGARTLHARSADVASAWLPSLPPKSIACVPRILPPDC